MMLGRVPLWPLVVGIVMVATGCDNVSWGGLDVSLRPPSSDTAGAPEDTAQAPAPEEPSSTLGAVLYAGVRSGNRARVVPVAEITADGLQPIGGDSVGALAADQILRNRLRPGAILTLFHQGVRVGNLVVDETDEAPSDYCQPRPGGSGQLLLSPDAMEAGQFVALDEGRGGPQSFQPYRELSSVYDQRVASLNLGSEAIPLIGAPWPPSLLEIRQDLQILPISGTGAPAVMATFMHQDQLQVGPAPNQAYALMVLGEPRGSRFELVFTWYRPVATEGKGAPRYFSRVDWDGDGEQEILLEVLGADSRWFAALDRGAEGWTVSYQDPCGAPGAQGGGG